MAGTPSHSRSPRPSMETSPGQVTRLLERWSGGDETAFAALVTLVYDDLRAIAHRRLRVGRAPEAPATTALVNEAYLRLVDHTGGRWESRAQFFALFAEGAP